MSPTAVLERRAAATPSNRLNFSAGPGALPEEVLQAAQAAVVALPQTGLSVLGMSHRSAWFVDLLAEAEQLVRQLLDVPQTHRILFLQGGSSLQFSMIPMNFAPTGTAAPEYLRSGYWSAKSIEEARCVRPLRTAWDGAAGGYRALPADGGFAVDPRAPYLHYVSNETVEGLQFAEPPRPAYEPPSTWIADMSSDFLSRAVDFERHGMVYAHAQKNLGPAGVTVSVVDERLLERVPDGLPPMLDFRTHVKHRSNYNTPPVFGIYVLVLVARWLRDTIGGVEAMARINRAKAERVYGTLDAMPQLVEMHAARACRSTMNASFRFRDPRLQESFLAEAAAAGFSGLAGHRSLGGLRISLYNAVTESAVAELCALLQQFAATHG